MKIPEVAKRKLVFAAKWFIAIFVFYEIFTTAFDERRVVVRLRNGSTKSIVVRVVDDRGDGPDVEVLLPGERRNVAAVPQPWRFAIVVLDGKTGVALGSLPIRKDDIRDRQIELSYPFAERMRPVSALEAQAFHSP